MWGIPELVQKLTDAFNSTISFFSPVVGFFNPEFFGLIGLTAIVVGVALLLCRFFPVLCGVGGAGVAGVAGMWYGYIKGQDSKQKEIDKLKAQAKVKVKPVPVAPKRDEWKW